MLDITFGHVLSSAKIHVVGLEPFLLILDDSLLFGKGYQHFINGLSDHINLHRVAQLDAQIL